MGNEQRAASTFLAVAAVAIGLVVAFSGGIVAALASVGIAVAAIIAVAWGIRRHRPAAAAAWWAIDIGLAVHLAAGLASVAAIHSGRTTPWPAGHALHSIGYLLLGAGVLILLNNQKLRDDPAEWLDVLVITAAVGLVIWGTLLRPFSDTHGLDGQTTVIMTMYPLLSLAIFGCAIQLWIASSATRSRSIRLLVTGLLLLVAANTLQLFVSVDGHTWLTPIVVALRLLFFAHVAAAALLPSMADPITPTRAARRTPWWRFASLTALAGIAPLGVVLSDVAGSRDTYYPGMLLGSLILFALVIVRLALLGRALDRSSMRDRTLNATGNHLVQTIDLDGVRTVARDAVVELLGDPRTHVWLVTDPALCAQGEASLHDATGGRAVRILRYPHPVHDFFHVDDPDVNMIVLQLDTHAAGKTLMVVSTSSNPNLADRTALVQLSDSVAHAIDRIQYADRAVTQQSEQRIQRLLHDASDVIAVIDRDLSVRYVTTAVGKLLGVGPRTIIGHPWIDLVHPEDRAAVRSSMRTSKPGRTARTEVRLMADDGGDRYVEMSVSRISDDDGGGYTISCHDITRRFELEQQLKHQAFHDALTGLANRALLQDRLRQTVERSRRDGTEFAVLFIDLDDFKTVNDSLGHAIGDALLRTVARRIRTTVRSQDTAARLGGDEFAILVEGVEDHALVEAVAERLVAALCEPVRVGGAELLVAGSVGVAYGSGRTKDVEDVMRNADLALYEAKGTGKNRYTVFRPELHEHAVGKLQLTADMRRGIARNEFGVHFQPLVDLRDGTIIGVEALARWDHPRRGLLAPAHFVSVAEETGLVVPLGREILEAALMEAGRWQTILGRSLLVSVNLSGRQLQDSCIVDDVRFALSVSGVDPTNLLLEITESVLLPGEGITAERLTELSDLGLRLYIDDFGTGYSSLSYLRQLPVRGIKLAREFVQTLPGTEAESGLVTTIRSLAETLQLDPVVAEGIETAEQRDELVRLGFTIGQGFYLARPQTADEMTTTFRAIAGGVPLQRAVERAASTHHAPV